MTPEEFRNIAQGIQAILISLAALGGGIWALTKFGITRERSRAKLELDKLESETKKLTGISSKIQITQTEHVDNTFYVYIYVELTNHSPRIKTLKVDDFPFRVNKVCLEDGGWSFEEKVRLKIAEAPSASKETAWEWPTSISLLPETPRTISLFYQTAEAGNYLFSLICDSQKQEAKTNEDELSLQYGKDIYENYRDHPFYVSESTPKFEIHKHCYVGPNNTMQPNAGLAPEK